MKTYGEWIECVSTDPQFRVFLRFDLKAKRHWVEKIDTALIGAMQEGWIQSHLDRIWEREGARCESAGLRSRRALLCSAGALPGPSGDLALHHRRQGVLVLMTYVVSLLISFGLLALAFYTQRPYRR